VSEISCPNASLDLSLLIGGIRLHVIAQSKEDAISDILIYYKPMVYNISLDIYVRTSRVP
jgi:hypothetical protein